LHFTTWRGIFAVLALIGVALLGAAAAGLPETLPPDRRRSGGGRAILRDGGRLVTDREFRGYALASGLAFAAMFAYISGSPFVLQAMFGISPQLFSVIFAINGLGIIVAGQVARRLIGRVSPRALLAARLSGSAAGGVTLLITALAARACRQSCQRCSSSWRASASSCRTPRHLPSRTMLATREAHPPCLASPCSPSAQPPRH
jgi:MFS transporter, DHA1 family, multidrug resistance protein